MTSIMLVECGTDVVVAIRAAPARTDGRRELSNRNAAGYTPGRMSGLDLQRQLKSEGSTIPVIIVTAFDDDRSREEAERLGCVAFLRKPCEAATILTLLRQLGDADR